ncbi:hypothetical protein GUJ93_ZPchr0013g36505 [Zizania palustris]|uniref:CRC domain-containing protein n=1 Tax=Zizania palustris TaxID=103762 RepID=A0A8J5WUM1_ZIZPA|nr:hypothetical protein GUJ93_ZPchr0013g36505 [Zizania palustris]
MDSPDLGPEPDTPPVPDAGAGSKILHQLDSPVFDFINTLSPIATSKPLDAVQNVHLFKSSDLALVSSIFASPQVNSPKGSKLSIRNASAQLSEEGMYPHSLMTRIGTSSNLPQRIQLGSDTLGSDSKQDTADKTDHITGQEHAELSSICFDHSDLDRMEAPTSRMNVQERNLAKKYNDELAAHNWDNIISHCGSSVVTKSDLGFEKSQLVDMTPKNNDVIPSYSVPINDKNFNNSQRSLGKGVATNYVSSVQPFSSQSQLVPKHQLCGPLDVPSYYMAMNHNAASQHPHGLHWHSVFNEKTTLPTNIGDSGQENPKRKRRKCKHGDVESCKRCSCKKSECLKLYCECFAAKVYCSEFCSCGGCLNNHSHEKTVLSTRIQIERRNPLAFAPKVICTSGPDQDFGEDSNATPASSRHKRGCNCKKSYCLKKYCECFQSGVGCSMSCRCESCKNYFGIRKGAQLLASEEITRLDQKNEARLKEEQHEASKHRAFGETCGAPSTENLFATPSTEPRRSLALPPSSEFSKPSLPPTSTSSQLCSPTRTDVVLSHFGSYTEMHIGDGPSDMQQQQEDSSCTASVKVMSPSKKRVSPLHTVSSSKPSLNLHLRFVVVWLISSIKNSGVSN